VDTDVVEAESVNAAMDDEVKGLRRSKRKTKVRSKSIIESGDEVEEVTAPTMADDGEWQEGEKDRREMTETRSIEEMVEEMATVDDVVKIEDTDAKGKGKAKSTGKGEATSKGKDEVIPVATRVSKRRATPIIGADESLLASRMSSYHFALAALTNSMLAQDKFLSSITDEHAVASTSLAALEQSTYGESEDDVIVPTSDNAVCMCFYPFKKIKSNNY
jgi:hypothetical protein